MWSASRTATNVGGRASSRSQTSVASSGGARGSSSATSPPDSTQTEVTTGSQSASGVQSGCSLRQSQTPGATSRTSTVMRRFSQRTRYSAAVTTQAPLYGSGQSRFARYLERRELERPDAVAREHRQRLL